jgi:hypothetical protein
VAVALAAVAAAAAGAALGNRGVRDMSMHVETMTIGLPSKVRPILDDIAGETPDQKIAYLLLEAIRRNLEACEREQLDLEIKYGLEYEDFKRKLETGEFGNDFEYVLEMDALRWGDLTVEKRHWLQQLSSLRVLSQ